MIYALIGIGVAVLGLAGLAVYQQARAKREKQEQAPVLKGETASRANDPIKVASEPQPRKTEVKAKVDEVMEPEPGQERPHGFPLPMLAGTFAGALLAVGMSFLLAPDGHRVMYTTLFQLTCAFAGSGVYLGHMIGALRHPEAGHKPFGPLTPGVMRSGVAIWFFGVAVAVGTVAGVMVALHGPPPH